MQHLTLTERLRVAAVQTFFCDVDTPEQCLAVYAELQELCETEPYEPWPHEEFPVWERFEDMHVTDLLGTVDCLVNTTKRLLA